MKKDARDRALALIIKASGLVATGRWEEARDVYTSALKLDATKSDEQMLAFCHHDMAVIHGRLFQHAEAIPHAASAEELSLKIGKFDAALVARSIRAQCLVMTGDESAVPILEETRRALESTQPGATAEIENFLGIYYTSKDDFVGGVPILRTASKRFLNVGDISAAAHSRFLPGWFLLERGFLKEAEDDFRAARTLFRRAGLPEKVAETDEALAEVAERAGDLPRAIKFYERAARAWDELDDMLSLVFNERAQEKLLKQLGREDEAAAMGLKVSLHEELLADGDEVESGFSSAGSPSGG